MSPLQRTYRTMNSRREAAAANTREARRLMCGARRASRRHVRLLAAYFGVGEPVPRLVVLFWHGRRAVLSV